MDQYVDGQALLDRVAAVGTAALSDALDQLRINGVVSGIRRRTGKGRAVGFAATVTATTGELGEFDASEFAVFPIFNAVSPNTMLVISLDGNEVSTFGGLAGLTLKARGAAGVIIDGACRDVDELAALDLTVASRCVTPRSGRGRVRVGVRDEPIVCGGVSIAAKDVIMVDDTGVVVIPRAKVLNVLEIAEEIEMRDAAQERRIREAMELP